MFEPAARVSDMHTCPKVEFFPLGNGTTVAVPHIGGPIVAAGATNVMIEGQGAAMMGSLCTCTAGGSPYLGPTIDTIVTGSSTVRINGKAAARRGDRTAHGGVITTGAQTVRIGG